MAEEFGRRLLADVDVVGFDEVGLILAKISNQPPRRFDCAQLDGIIQTLRECNAPTLVHQAPIVELTSIAPQGGKTHLLYLLASIAVTTTLYGGQEACVAILDADASFDVHRLAQQIRLRLESRASDLATAQIDAQLRAALDHVYILKPQSATALIATVAGLPDWFLEQRHRSLDRPIAFIAIDSINAFNFPAATAAAQNSSESLTYADLAATIKASSKALHCPIVLTTRYQGILPRNNDDSMPRSLRPDFGALWRPDLRLIVRRIPVRNIPSGLSSQEVARETADRMKIVALGRFECVVNEYGLDQRTLQALYTAQDGFFFRIKQSGLTMETAEQC